MPKLWEDTIASHRSAVREAILDAAAALVDERGVTGVSMAEVAQRAGVGRATLYKYFADVDAVLSAWHHRQVAAHLQQLDDVWERTHRIDDVLEAYAFIRHEHPPTAAPSLHRRQHARDRLIDFVAERLGDVRTDVPKKELATYAVHALDAADAVPSKAAVRRLVAVTLSGLRDESPR